MDKNTNKQLTILWLYIIVLAVGTAYIYFSYLKPSIPSIKLTTNEKTVKTFANQINIASDAFKHNEMIPSKYTCLGENINPPLRITGTPNGTKSLVLIVQDPNALFKVWTHWFVFNIDPKTSYIAENSVPASSVLGENDNGKLDYVGPCPISGKHQYNFTIYALDTILEFQTGADVNIVEKEIEDHTIDMSQLTGFFEK